jgi:acyl-coenzyme A thioesterase PaaI-like protein
MRAKKRRRGIAIVLSFAPMAANRLSRSLAPLDRLPAPLRTAARSLVLGRIVKFVGTAGLRVEELTASRAVVSIRNRTRVQNHIGSVHAAAMALLAETASGFVVGMNVPDDRVPVIKSLALDYRKRATGSLRAVATLSDEQRAHIRDSDKGEVTVAVNVTDEAGIEPVECRMIWAWTPKRPNKG